MLAYLFGERPVSMAAICAAAGFSTRLGRRHWIRHIDRDPDQLRSRRSRRRHSPLPSPRRAPLQVPHAVGDDPRHLPRPKEQSFRRRAGPQAGASVVLRTYVVAGRRGPTHPPTHAPPAATIMPDRHVRLGLTPSSNRQRGHPDQRGPSVRQAPQAVPYFFLSVCGCDDGMELKSVCSCVFSLLRVRPAK